MREITGLLVKRALIATLFNEAESLARWWDCLLRQTELPDEIVIVDAESRDGTWERLQMLADKSPIPVKLARRRCNIAEGRNHAILLTDAQIIASTDGGSFPDPNWFQEITRPLLEDPTADLVGGRSWATAETPFQKFQRLFEPGYDTPQAEGAVFSSSRNIAFRRQTWASVGGYPEWLTLAAEDALFNYQLHTVGKKFVPNPEAIVRWPERETANAYFKMLYRNGFGAAEARLYSPYFCKRLVITAFPPLLLLSRHRFRHLGFRYRKNLSSAMGWLAGKIVGKRPPAGWINKDGVLLSPQAQENLPR